MAQLRHDHEKFAELNTKVFVMVPNGPKMIEKHIQKNNTPYRILSDKGLKVAAQYFQVKKFFAIGTPTVFLVNQNGEILYTFYGKSIQDIPNNDEPLVVLQKLNQ